MDGENYYSAKLRWITGKLIRQIKEQKSCFYLEHEKFRNSILQSFTHLIHYCLYQKSTEIKRKGYTKILRL